MGFAPVHMEAAKGKTYYAFMSQKELVRRFLEPQSRLGRCGVTASEAKAALRQAMKEYGRELKTMRPISGAGRSRDGLR